MSEVGHHASDWSIDDEGDEAMNAIDEEYRRMIAGLRRLPRHERPHALRAARERRAMATRTLRETRSAERHSQHERRRLQQLDIT